MSQMQASDDKKRFAFDVSQCQVWWVKEPSEDIVKHAKFDATNANTCNAEFHHSWYFKEENFSRIEGKHFTWRQFLDLHFTQPTVFRVKEYALSRKMSEDTRENSWLGKISDPALKDEKLRMLFYRRFVVCLPGDFHYYFVSQKSSKASQSKICMIEKRTMRNALNQLQVFYMPNVRREYQAVRLQKMTTPHMSMLKSIDEYVIQCKKSRRALPPIAVFVSSTTYDPMVWSKIFSFLVK